MPITSSKTATDVAVAKCIEAFAAMHEADTAANRTAVAAARLRLEQAIEAEFAPEVRVRP